MIRELKTACLTADAAATLNTENPAARCDFSRKEFFDLAKGSMLLEVFAFEIQMCIDLK